MAKVSQEGQGLICEITPLGGGGVGVRGFVGVSLKRVRECVCYKIR